MEPKAPAVCELCGEPMPPGEEVFKFHGYSCECPKPPLPKPRIEAVIEYFHRETDDKFWLDVVVNRSDRTSFPFDTARERQLAHDDLLSMMRSVGALDLPGKPQ